MYVGNVCVSTYLFCVDYLFTSPSLGGDGQILSHFLGCPGDIVWQYFQVGHAHTHIYIGAVSWSRQIKLTLGPMSLQVHKLSSA